jgi:uncharacterized protein (TIGR02118 family)
MIKATALYGHPAGPEAFESYYANTLMPLAAKIKELTKAETTEFLPNPDGTPGAYYRMAELYFNSVDDLQQALTSRQGQATVADLSNIATGGVTLITGMVEN